MRFSRWSWLAGLVQACLLSLLVSCGGGGDGNSTPLPVTPPSDTPAPITPAPITPPPDTPPPITPPPTVAGAPVITRQPASQTVPSGSSATFTIEVQDAAGVAYQWLRNGAEVAGASGATYSLQNATVQDSGTLWSVRLTNPGGTVTSAQALLTVDPPSIIVPPDVPPSPPQSGAGISFMAGSTSGPGTLDGVGRAAYFDRPLGIATDAAGTLYVADWANATIRKVTTDGTVSTLAGVARLTGEQDGVGTAARFANPHGLTLATDGSLYVIDFGGKLRHVTMDGSVTTVPGISQVAALATAPNGGLYLAGRGAIYRWAPDAGLTLLAGLDGFSGSENGTGTVDGIGTAARFGPIFGMAVDAAGNIYVTQPYSNTVRKITPAGVVSTFAGVAGQWGTVDGIGSDARLDSPAGIAVDSGGNIWVVEDSSDGLFRRISPAGAVTTPFGRAIGRAITAKNSIYLLFPRITFAPSGDLYFSSDLGVDRITPAGSVSAVAGQDFVDSAPIGDVHALAVDPAGNTVATIAPQCCEQVALTRFSPDGVRIGFGSVGDVALPSANVYQPKMQGIATDSAGNVYASDIEYVGQLVNIFTATGGRISRVSPGGDVTTVVAWPAGTAGALAPAFMTVGRDGAIYFVDLIRGTLMRWTAASGATELASLGIRNSLFNLPAVSLAVDGAGTVYVLMQGAVQKVVNIPLAPDGTRVMLADASNFVGPSSIVADAIGNVYVADREVIRKVSPYGTVTTVAGQRNVIGLQTGALPGSLGPVGAMALGADGTLRVMSGDALVKIKLQ